MADKAAEWIATDYSENMVKKQKEKDTAGKKQQYTSTFRILLFFRQLIPVIHSRSIDDAAHVPRCIDSAESLRHRTW